MFRPTKRTPRLRLAIEAFFHDHLALSDASVRQAKGRRARRRPAGSRARFCARGRSRGLPSGPTLWRRPSADGVAESGPDAAMGPERSQVGRLIEQPESLPLVTGLPEVFRVHEQLFNSPRPVCRIVRQGDRCTSLEQREGCDHDRQGRQSFRISGSSRLAVLGSVDPRNPCVSPIEGLVAGGSPRIEPNSSPARVRRWPHAP